MAALFSSTLHGSSCSHDPPPPCGCLRRSAFIRRRSPDAVSSYFERFDSAAALDHLLILVDGRGIWRSDGTTEGTFQLEAYNGINQLIEPFAGGKFVFLSLGDQLWRTDGTIDGTIPLVPMPRATLIPLKCSNAVTIGANVFWFSCGSHLAQTTLWRSDGTPSGTIPVYRYNFDNRFPSLAVANGKLYFPGWDSAHGWEPWISDGTSEGTRLFSDVYPGPASSFPREFVTAGDRVFFSAETPGILRELWAIDTRGPGKRRAVRP